MKAEHYGKRTEDALVIHNEVGDVIDVFLSPCRTPATYQRKKKELIEIAGMTEEEAERDLLHPMQLELFYDIGRGLFAVESEAVDSTEIYNPYTGEEIPKEPEE